MSSWRGEYLAALEARDQREKANHELFQAYTRLADRSSSSSSFQPTIPGPSQAAGGDAVPRSPNPATPTTPRSPGPALPTMAVSPRPANPGPPSQPAETLLADLKRDLSEAQRSKADLQARLKAKTDELELVKTRYQQSSDQARELSTERTAVVTRLRDKDEEIRGKARLLEDFQDEVISLNIQLNMAERRATELQHENRELVDRWMAKMGKEADEMNEASKFS